MNYQTIAIDGPASSGKSTIAKRIAEQLGIMYLDTGAMYRAVSLLMMRQGTDLTDEQAVHQLLERLSLTFEWKEDGQHILLDGEDVSQVIRTPEVTAYVSEVSALKLVRESLVRLQQQMAKEHAVVMDGRDIGTVVLPNAAHKFFFVASPLVRAQRRYLDNQQRGIDGGTVEELQKAIEQRDYEDSHREHGPLRKAEDAIEIDTSYLTIDEVVQTVIQHLQP